MRLYSIIMSISAALIILFTSVFGFGVGYAVLSTLIGILAVMAFDCASAILIRLLPAKWFSRDKRFFVMGKREKKIMTKLGIRVWKDKVPDLGNKDGFCKRRLVTPHDNDYVAKYLLESAYGQIIHLVVAVLGFAVIFIYPLNIWYCFGLPIATVNAVLNLMSMFTLRYNFGRLKTLYAYNERRKARAAAVENSTESDAQ